MCYPVVDKVDMSVCGVLPFEVDCGDIEDDSFQQKDHEEPLREWTVTNALPITASLHKRRQCIVFFLTHNTAQTHSVFTSEVCGFFILVSLRRHLTMREPDGWRKLHLPLRITQ